MGACFTASTGHASSGRSNETLMKPTTTAKTMNSIRPNLMDACRRSWPSSVTVL